MPDSVRDDSKRNGQDQLNRGTPCRDDILQGISIGMTTGSMFLTIFDTGSPLAFSHSENGLTLPEGLMLMKMMYNIVKR